MVAAAMMAVAHLAIWALVVLAMLCGIAIEQAGRSGRGDRRRAAHAGLGPCVIWGCAALWLAFWAGGLE